MKTPTIAICLVLEMIGALSAAEPQLTNAPATPGNPKDIKAYCLDFNWAASGRKRKPFAAPGTWAGANPAEHVAWYKAMGANVIQTFCVSTNGYAWYKNGFVPEQPGLKHDFLPEVVKLGHQENMLVFGYFCVSANPVWGTAHPEQSYGTPTTYHKEADWLMNESGDKKSIDAVKAMVGPHTRLITCLARWNGKDATQVVPEALAAGIGLYGFTVPRTGGGIVPLEEILSRPVSELKGDDRNIAVLARAFHGASIESGRNEKGGFTEPAK